MFWSLVTNKLLRTELRSRVLLSSKPNTSLVSRSIFSTYVFCRPIQQFFQAWMKNTCSQNYWISWLKCLNISEFLCLYLHQLSRYFTRKSIRHSLISVNICFLDPPQHTSFFYILFTEQSGLEIQKMPLYWSL